MMPIHPAFQRKAVTVHMDLYLKEQSLMSLHKITRQDLARGPRKGADFLLKASAKQSNHILLEVHLAQPFISIREDGQPYDDIGVRKFGGPAGYILADKRDCQLEAAALNEMGFDGERGVGSVRYH